MMPSASAGSHDGEARDSKPKKDRIGKIEELPYFHGILPREEIAELLEKNGNFLVRVTEPLPGQETFVVSVRSEGAIRHFPATCNIVGNKLKQEWCFGGGPKFSTAKELVLYYYINKQAITPRSGVVLGKPVERKWWELEDSSIWLMQELGRGQFGKVHRGLLKNYAKKQIEAVAVKSCDKNRQEHDKMQFLREARIMRRYQHPNIVMLMGISINSQPIKIIMELMKEGSLDQYLVKHRGMIQMKEKAKLTLDVASAMKFLASKFVLHRDLAARNVLLTRDKENELMAKLGDFGLSQEAADGVYELRENARVSTRWAAPEAFRKHVWKTKSDVWSFGILMWEIYAEGSEPFEGETLIEAAKKIVSGVPLEPPDDMALELKVLFKSCCEYHARDRADFPKIVAVLKTHYKRLAGKIF